MKPRLHSRLWLATALLLTTLASSAAMVVGGIVYCKRYETNLLSEPKPLSKATARLPLGRKLKVEEVRGIWLRVNDGKKTGWVFNGNISETKPAEVTSLEGEPVSASQTTATAAARPIAPAAVEYASRHHLNSNTSDLDWLLDTCHTISRADVDAYLQKQKKGEFQ